MTGVFDRGKFNNPQFQVSINDQNTQLVALGKVADSQPGGEVNLPAHALTHPDLAFVELINEKLQEGLKPNKDFISALRETTCVEAQQFLKELACSPLTAQEARGNKLIQNFLRKGLGLIKGSVDPDSQSASSILLTALFPIAGFVTSVWMGVKVGGLMSGGVAAAALGVGTFLMTVGVTCLGGTLSRLIIGDLLAKGLNRLLMPFERSEQDYRFALSLRKLAAQALLDNPYLANKVQVYCEVVKKQGKGFLDLARYITWEEKAKERDYISRLITSSDKLERSVGIGLLSTKDVGGLRGQQPVTASRYSAHPDGIRMSRLNDYFKQILS